MSKRNVSLENPIEYVYNEIMSADRQEIRDYHPDNLNDIFMKFRSKTEEGKFDPSLASNVIAKIRDSVIDKELKDGADIAFKKVEKIKNSEA